MSRDWVLPFGVLYTFLPCFYTKYCFQDLKCIVCILTLFLYKILFPGFKHITFQSHGYKKVQRNHNISIQKLIKFITKTSKTRTIDQGEKINRTPKIKIKNLESQWSSTSKIQAQYQQNKRSIKVKHLRRHGYDVWVWKKVNNKKKNIFSNLNWMVLEWRFMVMRVVIVKNKVPIYIYIYLQILDLNKYI